MKLILVGPELEENLSLPYLSGALLAAGHEVTIATFNVVGDTDRVLREAEGADIVGLSLSFQVRAREYLALAGKLKERDPKRRVIAGGHFASCAAEPLLREHPALDLVVIHEGEQTIVEIADAGGALDERLPQIAGIVWRRGDELCKNPPRRAVEDLDTLALPDRRGPAFMLAGVPTAYLLGSRGCFESCAYCCITTLHRLAPGKRFRQRDPDKVADEMADLYHGRGVRQFVFHDDTFLVPGVAHNHARIDALQGGLARRGVKNFAFTMKCRPADVDESVFRRLRDLGLVRVFLGIETSTEAGLRCLNRRQTLAEEERALETCTRIGVSAQFTIMIFHPDATLETVRQDIGFMRKYADHPLNFCRAELYAGTPLEQRMVSEGRARGSYLARGYSLGEPGVDLACKTTLRLMAERCWNGRGLVNRAIGFNHLVAAAGVFHPGSAMTALRRRASAWHRLVNADTLDLLERIVVSCSAASSTEGAGVAEAIGAIQDGEAMTRAMLLSQLDGLRAELSVLTGEVKTGSGSPTPAKARMPAAAPVAAAVLAMSLAGCGGQQGISEMAAPPCDAAAGDGNACDAHGGDAVADHIGMGEVAPPPVDGGDAGKGDSGKGAEIGVSEIAPPPVDGGGGG